MQVTKLQIIAAEGEQKASFALKEAADVINESPFAVQLRYLQTLSTISAEKNSTIIFPLPVDLVAHFMRRGPPCPATSRTPAPVALHTTPEMRPRHQASAPEVHRSQRNPNNEERAKTGGSLGGHGICRESMANGTNGTCSNSSVASM
ncbi:unnamed protein product, partial [Protopolystoma xenopodis]